jgi:hypothetical protein
VTLDTLENYIKGIRLVFGPTIHSTELMIKTKRDSAPIVTLRSNGSKFNASISVHITNPYDENIDAVYLEADIAGDIEF